MSDDTLLDLLSGYRPADPGPQLRPRILTTRRADARWRLGILSATAIAASVWGIALTLTSRTYSEISSDRSRTRQGLVSQTIQADIVELAGDEQRAAFVIAQAAAAAQAIADDNASFGAASNR